ncbi:MAG: glycosyltransferase family 4 protein [Marmoricola sp.]
MLVTEPVPGPSADCWDDPAEGLAVLHVVDRVSATNSQFNEHCLPTMDRRHITVCSLFPSGVAVPSKIRLVEGDGSLSGCLRALRRALATAEYDVVHVHAPASGVLTLFAYLRARRPRRDLVFTVHNSWSSFRPRNRLLLLAIAAFFPVLVVCGDSAARSLPRRMRRLVRRLEVVPNGVDVERVDRVLAAGGPRAHLSEVEPGTEPAIEIVSVNRLIPIKDPATVVAAFDAAAGPGDRLALVGAGPLARELAAATGPARLGNRVRLTGLVAREEVYRILDRAAIYISASRGEGLPVSVLEAMACRCPVVLSDIPPHRDIARLVPGIPLVEVGDVAGFAEAIARLRRLSPAARQRLGEGMRAAVVEHFSVRAMGASYGEVYRTVSRRNGPPTGSLVRRGPHRKSPKEVRR